MNYIWELAITAKTNNYDEDAIYYRYGQPFSGYMELSLECMNDQDIHEEVEINPYYRYYSIFKELYNPNVLEDCEIRDTVLDLTIHHLKDIDVLMGMNKKEYYIEFIIKDMKSGYFGEFIKENIDVFSLAEQKIAANYLLHLYKTAECVHLLKLAVRSFFSKSYIFTNKEKKDEIIVFLRTEKNKEDMEKIEIITYLFSPLKCRVKIYWDKIFGIIGVEDMMKIGKILI